MRTYLYVGRFQPFHLGHLSALKQALANCDFLIIGIGSSQYSNTPDNPFTATERTEMIKAALDENQIGSKKYKIILVSNVENNDLWPAHVVKTVPTFDTLFTGSEIVKTLFENYNKTVGTHNQKPIQINSPTFEKDISATKVRQAIIKDQDWQKLVPKSVAKILQNISAPEKLKAITKPSQQS